MSWSGSASRPPVSGSSLPLACFHLQQSGGYVVRLRTARFEYSHIRQQFIQECCLRCSAKPQQFFHPVLAKKALAGIHCLRYAVRKDQEFVSWAHLHGGGFVDASCDQSQRHAGENVKPLDCATGPAQEGGDMTRTRIG